MPELAGIPSPPAIIISSYTLPERIEEGTTFVLEVRANNASPTLADKVTVELTGGNLISPSSDTVSLGQMGSGEEKAATFKLKAKESGFDVVTLRVFSGEEVLSSQMVYLDIDPSTGGFNTRTLILVGGVGLIGIIALAAFVVLKRR